jgi:hypothetical protein
MQDLDYSLTELCSDLSFGVGDFGRVDPPKALPGGSVAAVNTIQGAFFNVFFQGPDRAIYGRKFLDLWAGWQPPRLVVYDAMALTAISAVAATGMLLCVHFCNH